MKILRSLAVTAIAVHVSACKTTSSDLAATTETIGEVPAGVTLTRNDDDTYTLSNGNPDDDMIIGDYQVGTTGIERYLFLNGSMGRSYFTVVLHGKTPSGAGEATYIFSPPAANNGFEFSATDLARIGTTAIPDGGTIEMTGSTAIAGFQNGAYGLVAGGSALLTVNFDDSLVSGRTFDLTGFISSSDFNNLAAEFEVTNLIDGSFTGTINPDEDGYLNGTYDGLIVGPDGTEAIGTYTFTGPSGGLYEGIFVVGETPSP